ncbi:MAG: polymer-forming cytoskeletal protein [Candidatus Omnitrophica bacterium]|nr:polymer-forming cytoskeletal protein [Candidatus Omnitrophota bacterium]MBU2044257.1 polymer-forming cytoskeletal protein [Candidatus Omnitrophota bacterium]MBU2251517.1 polymer-forming cytoskeletal protein [Candidatus Omnitrophota bacterium]MBU2266078.1 polymer-forming cytoskeletal protein [Candidatus Omnitrophota bacterium]MBU2474066.1 polymer-forming cytoskeletal protein [Candidatus Omnitrophota bacterium]
MVKRRVDEKILDVSAAMQGSLVFSDPVNLRINGKFEGNLATKGSLTIGSNADVRADISGEEVIVSGTVRGNIRASEGIRLTSTAKVFGDIDVAQVTIEKGAIFNGKCRMNEGKISLEELSDYLAVEEKKIMEWVEGGKIPVEKEGSKFLFDRAQVEDWIAHKF